MKYILFVIVIATLSCKSHKETMLNNEEIVINENYLTNEEKNILTDFLTVELKKKRYKRYINYEFIVIEEALKKQKSITTYELNYNYKSSWGKFINEWILDSLQIRKLKNELKNEEIYNWKLSNFKNFKVSLLKNEELIKTTNTGEYLQNRLIIYLSKPLIIDKNNAFVSFEIGIGDLGFSSLTHFTVLMTKTGNIWAENGLYYDGVYN